jgi:hypothetical protein
MIAHGRDGSDPQRKSPRAVLGAAGCAIDVYDVAAVGLVVPGGAGKRRKDSAIG